MLQSYKISAAYAMKQPVIKKPVNTFAGCCFAFFDDISMMPYAWLYVMF